MIYIRLVVLYFILFFTRETLATCTINDGDLVCVSTNVSEFTTFVSKLSQNVNSLSFLNTNIYTLTITMFNYTLLKTMERLNIVNCNISAIENSTFIGYDQLKKIDIEINTALTEINSRTFEGATNLEELKFDKAGLVEIEPGAFVNTRKLNLISFENNRISTLQTGTFFGASPTGSIYLNKNNIVNIKPEAFYGLDKADTLYLRSNNFTVLVDNTFVGLTKLRFLYLNNNELSSLNYAAFKGLDNLEVLDLSNTGITQYDIDKLREYMPKLKSVITT